jgi:cytochrome P450
MMEMPRPLPFGAKRLGLRGFLRVADSWLDALTDRSYHMLLGHFWLPRMRVFVVNDPAWVERILVQEPQRYPKHHLMHEALEPLIGSSPFTTNGPLWQRQRRMLDQAFGHARLNRVFPFMQQACQDMLGRLQGGPAQQAFDVDAAMTHVTADIVYRTIFSEALSGPDAQRVYEAFTRYQVLSQKHMVCRLLRVPPWGLAGRRKRQALVIRTFLADKVRERFARCSVAQEREGADILAGLRSAVDPQDGSSLNEQEVLDQICMLFLAGHETSASALSWCLYVLGQAPQLQTDVQAELQRVAPGRDLQPGDLRQLPRLTAMFREVLRLYPPVGYFPREAMEDQLIRGKPVRRGDALLVFPWLLHRHRQWWKNPDAFEPERFAPERTESPLRGTYLPFGLGARACIGAGFAMQEAALILGALLREFDVQPVPGFVPRVVGRLTVRSDQGIEVILSRRSA